MDVDVDVQEKEAEVGHAVVDEMDGMGCGR